MSESSPPATRPVTVSIVSHRQWSLAAPLLHQLDRWCGTSIEKVVLTLNTPEPVDLNRQWSFDLKVLENPAPLGFGANHNGAFAHCGTPWFLVLNPDIRIDGDILAPMLALARPDAGLLAPRIQEPGCPKPEPYRGLLTPWELLQRRRANHRPPERPAWVAGMFMLTRREAFQQVGGFDTRYFMYCEDFDLCARMRLAEWDLQITDGVTVLHEARRASNSSFKPLLWHLASFAKVWTSVTFWRYAAKLRRDELAT